MGRLIITKDDALEIKKLLWNGVNLATISLMYEVTPTTISLIGTGVRHAEVPWPDTSLGRLSNHRIKQLRRERDAAHMTREILENREARSKLRHEKPLKKFKPYDRLDEENAFLYLQQTITSEVPDVVVERVKGAISFLIALKSENKHINPVQIDNFLKTEMRKWENRADETSEYYVKSEAPTIKKRRHKKSL
jgi:hypothetical protein